MGSRKLGLKFCQVRTRGRATSYDDGGATARACTQYNSDHVSEAGTPLLLLLGAIFVLLLHAQFMERLGLGPALLERVLARLGLAVQLVLALFVVLLVAPDLAALLHLRAAAGD